MIFEENMPSLAALLPDSAEDPLGTRGVLEYAFMFSCMLRDEATNAGPGADALYRSSAPCIDTRLSSRSAAAAASVGRSNVSARPFFPASPRYRPRRPSRRSYAGNRSSVNVRYWQLVAIPYRPRRCRVVH